jgi:hypothetical protein
MAESAAHVAKSAAESAPHVAASTAVTAAATTVGESRATGNAPDRNSRDKRYRRQPATAPTHC